MYDYLKGILASTSSTHLVLDVGGVGYKLHTPSNLSSQLPATGEELLLYTHLVVREDAHTLYGFLSSAQRELFTLLIAVSGIGPKIGIALLGFLSIKELLQAVERQNVPLICKTPGIGKKTAERLILEVRDKLPSLGIDLHSSESGEGSTEGELSLHSQTIRDAVSALVNLGYSTAAVEETVNAIARQGEEPPLADLITQALARLS